MNRVKNQHYVPRSYLERFTISGKIFVFDKESRKVFPSNVKYIASENGFYDLPPHASKEALAVEKVFGKIEGDVKTVLDALLSELETGKFDAHDHNRREVLATFIALQDTRTLAFRRTLEQIHHGFAGKLNSIMDMYREAFAKQGQTVNVPKYEAEYQKEEETANHAAIMFNPDYLVRAVKALMSHIWLVWRNDGPVPFYTSDSPVFHHAHVSHMLLGGSGLESRGVEIGIPLSPKYVLSLVERSFFEGLVSYEGSVLVPKDIRFYNFHQVLSSRRQVYCSGDQFDMAREYEKMNPEAFHMERQRFQIWGG